MGKFRVKQRTKCNKKRRDFCGTKEKKDVNTNDFINSANNVNTDANDCYSATAVDDDSVVGNVLENTDMDTSACSASSQKVQ